MTTSHLFSERLLSIFEEFSLTSTQFADKIGVQKSTLSHLLSNRNKPSLDLLLKIIEHFPALNLYWLADGRMPMYASEKSSIPSSSILDDKPSLEDLDVTTTKDSEYSNENAPSTVAPVFSQNMSKVFSQSSEIDYIVVLYKDGSFKRYKEL